MKQIPLRKSRAYTLISDIDYDWAMQWRWSLANNGYVIRYEKVDGKYKTVYLHREVMKRKLGGLIPAALQVDHQERDKLLNSRDALRLASRSQNQANKGLQINNTSQFKGVNANGSKFEARIRYQGKRLNLGRFDDPEIAALQYDCASRLLYQDFSGCNFPNTPTPACVETSVREKLVGYGIQL